MPSGGSVCAAMQERELLRDVAVKAGLRVHREHTDWTEFEPVEGLTLWVRADQGYWCMRGAELSELVADGNTPMQMLTFLVTRLLPPIIPLPPAPPPEPECPCTMYDVLVALAKRENVRPFTRTDYYGYAGVVGEPYMWEPGDGWWAVIDLIPPGKSEIENADVVVNVFMARPDPENTYPEPHCWIMHSNHTQPERIM